MKMILISYLIIEIFQIVEGYEYIKLIQVVINFIILLKDK